ncbi:RDD family protein [Emticicia sp. 17c]|uniref:RDD family protein n=1 Tax=Emticicia sp. 17c TaxID=3127704 RepID=UPI00301DBCAE
MNLTKKKIIILQAVCLIILPITLTIFNFYEYKALLTKYSEIAFSDTKLLKQFFLPFYNFDQNKLIFKLPDDYTDIEQLQIFHISFKLYYVITLIIIPILSIIGSFRFLKTGSFRILTGILLLNFFINFYGLFGLFFNIKYEILSPIVRIVRFVIAFFLLIVLSEKINVIHTTADTTKEPYIKQPRVKRFSHFLIDSILIFHLCFSYLYTFKSILLTFKSILLTFKKLIFSNSTESISSSSLSPLQTAFYIFIIVFTYYFISEGVFKATLGQVIVGSVAVENNGKLLSPYTNFGRTLARFIPFDAFSFLFNKKGWHDSASNTTVVKASYKTTTDIL